MVAHCCYFLRGCCTYGQTCTYSHDRSSVVKQCQYGDKCTNGHHCTNGRASNLMAQPSGLAARLEGFRGTFKSDLGSDVVADWATEAHGWTGPPKTAFRVLLRRDGNERQMFLRRNPDMGNYLKNGDELLCGDYTLNEAASTGNIVVWANANGDTHCWRRQLT